MNALPEVLSTDMVTGEGGGSAVKDPRLRIVVLGLSITSSWGNGHATTYRALLRALSRLGHAVTFLERDVPWYAKHRDLPHPDFCRTELYGSMGELRQRFAGTIRDADVVIVGSHLPEGIVIGEWVIRTARGITAFYDIDTPATIAKLDADECEHVTARLIPQYQLYLSFTGGPVLERIEQRYGSPCARPLYCSFDPLHYHAEPVDAEWDLGYIGNWDAHCQSSVDRLLTDTARRWAGGRFVVAGTQYPEYVRWPANVQRIEHVPPLQRRTFYCRQRFTLNVTRADAATAGYTPVVRLFEAAACGTPVIGDAWDGLETLFEPGTEILLPRSSREVLDLLVDMPERERRAIGRRARARVLQQHTAAHRADELVALVSTARAIVPAA